MPSLAFCFSLLFFFFFSFSHLAYPSSFGVAVGGVKVDEVADNAVEAKLVGMDRALRYSLSGVLTRFFPDFANRNVSDLGSAVIESAVAGFSISDELIVGNRYSAVISHRFDPIILLDLLKKLPKLSQKVKMIIPIFYDIGGEASLWENSWSDLWAKSNVFRVPTGDLDDIKSITIDVVKNKDWGALKRVATKYKADEVFIVEAYDGETEVFVQIETANSSQPVKLHYHYNYDGDDDDSLLKIITEDVGKRVESSESVGVDVESFLRDVGRFNSWNKLVIYCGEDYKVLEKLKRDLLPYYDYSVDYVGSTGIIISVKGVNKSSSLDILSDLKRLVKKVHLSKDGKVIFVGEKARKLGG